MLSGNFLVGGAFEDFVDVGLVGLRFLGGQAAELVEDPRGDADGDQVFGVASNRAAYAAGAAEFSVRGLGNIGKIDLTVRDMLRVPYGSRGAR